jgi:SAM-dependent methyltransferase
MDLYDRAKTREAWTIFWQEQGAESRCLEGASPEITQALLNHWSSFGASLPPKIRVLDIGCGGGAVGRWLVAARSDVQVTGIDIAKVPSAVDSQIELLSHTSMEALPFANASFSAAVSQFGYEYGRTDEAAKELARVLAPQAHFSFLVHHAASSVVAASRARLRALTTFLGEEMRGAFVSGDTSSFAAQMSFLKQNHPRDGLVAELARSLPSRLSKGDRERIGTWKAIEDALTPERRVLEALDACCLAPEGLEDWLAPLSNLFEVKNASIVRESNGQPLAWRIDGIQRSVTST